MSEQVISCPKCNARIPLGAALSQQLDVQLADEKRRQEEEMARKFASERERIEKEAVRKADEKRSVEMRDLQLQVQEKDKKLEESRQAELQLRKRERELEDAKKNADLELQRRLDAERKIVSEQARQAADQEHRQKQLESDKK